MLLDKAFHKRIMDGVIRDRELVCRCKGVRDEQVRQCIRQGNATLEALEEKLGVMSDCGFCKFRIQKLLEEELSETVRSQ
jgi:bacterioferritin-associated ferredoxin